MAFWSTRVIKKNSELEAGRCAGPHCGKRISKKSNVCSPKCAKNLARSW